MTVAIIGVGNMGGAVLDGLLEAGRTDVVAVVRQVRSVAAIAERGVKTLPASEAAAAADIVVIAVKPYAVLPMLQDIASALRPGAVVVSLAAGITTAQMEAVVPDGVSVVRVMPNTPALIGKGMSVVAAGAKATVEAQGAAEDLMMAIGKVVTVPEKQMDAAAAISGSGPAYVFYVAEALIEAGVHLGLTRADATTLVSQTLVGSSELMARTGTHPALLREQVTSPAGTTAAALRVLDHAGVRAAILDATRANRDRSRELAEE
jgi:pyrroline-5-carboxylate reductase